MPEARPEHERPTSRRPFRWRGALSAVLLLAIAAPLVVHFVWQPGIATLGDDSVSYLLLARWLAGDAGPLLAPWVSFQANFPPLFPLALAAAGGASNLIAAHLVVGGFALAGLVLVERYGTLRFGHAAAGFVLAAAFLALPTAWVSAKGILSEPMYLCVSLTALLFHARRIAAGSPRPRDWLVFGLLLAAAWLTRAASITLAAAFVAWAAQDAFLRRARPAAWAALPLACVAAAAVAWLLVRPEPAMDAYRLTIGEVARAWSVAPGELAPLALSYFFGGWVASFTADPDVGFLARSVFAAFGVLGLAGAVRAARAGRLDGWYVLASLALIVAWIFPVENMRRLLYPVVPLAMLHAAETMFALLGALRIGRGRGVYAAAACFAPILVSLPLTGVVLHRSFDDAPVLEGSQRSYAGITDYYTTLKVQRARAVAAREVAVLAGLEALGRVTPPEAKVMWVRPEYVALLGQRRGVPYFHGWDERRLAAEIRASGTTHVIVARLFKADLHGKEGDAYQALSAAKRYSEPVFALRNAVTGSGDFELLRVDAARLDAFLGPARPG
jgi:hypothetical protein